MQGNTVLSSAYPPPSFDTSTEGEPYFSGNPQHGNTAPSTGPALDPNLQYVATSTSNITPGGSVSGPIPMHEQVDPINSRLGEHDSSAQQSQFLCEYCTESFSKQHELK